MVIALIASVVTASQWTIGQLAVVWILTFVVRVGKFLTAWLRAVRSLSAIIARRVALNRSDVRYRT